MTIQRNHIFYFFPMIFCFSLFFFSIYVSVHHLQGRPGCSVLRGVDQQSASQLWRGDGKSHLWRVASLQGLRCDFWWPKNHLFFFVLFLVWEFLKVSSIFGRFHQFHPMNFQACPWREPQVGCRGDGKSNQNKDTQVDFILTTPTFNWLVSNKLLFFIW